MDRPVLYSLVERVRAQERLQEFAAALPTRARVSDPVLPLVLASLHDELGRGLVVALAEDADARDVAEAAGWFLGDDQVALFPSRGVRWESGLEPPPHLIGERARAFEVLERGGLVCVSAAALAEGMPPVGARPVPLRLAQGDEPGIDTLAEELARAGYERVERVEERGQFAVRGGLVDVYPTTGREPLRIELFGDEIEQIRAFSPFTQRALRQVEAATVYPAAERRAELVEIQLPDDEDEPVRVPDDLVAPFVGAPDVVCSPDEVRAVWEEEGFTPVSLAGATELSPLPQGQPFSFDAQRPALAARGLSEAENELGGLLSQELDVVVAFPHRGEALRQQALLRRSQRECARARPGARWARHSPSLRHGAASSGASSVSRCCRTRRSSGNARRARRRRPVGHCRASPICAPATTSCTRTTASRSCSGFETKEVAGVTRDYLLLAYRGDDRVYVPHEQIGKVSRYIGADSKAPTLSKLGGKAWDNLKTRARAHLREMAGELLQLYAQRQTQPGMAFDVEHEWVEQLENEFPVPRDGRPAHRDRSGEGGPRVAASDGPARLRRRRLRQDRGCVARRVRRRRQRQAGADARADDRARATALEHLQDALPRLPGPRRDGLAVPEAKETKQALRDFSEGKVEVLIGTHRVLSRDVIPKELGLVIVDEEQRFGVAQKELLRQLRLEVDVLAMSATPIPRTLHMSLAGLRDISVIETPPEGRRPIRTFVGEYDDELIGTALEREAARGGQAFYLHNRVDTIEEAAAKLAAALPRPALPRRARSDAGARAGGADDLVPRG